MDEVVTRRACRQEIPSRKALVVIFFWLATLAAWPQAGLQGQAAGPLCARDRLHRGILFGRRVSRETRSMLTLYIGNAESVRLDTLAVRTGLTRSVCLVHPVAATGGALKSSATSRLPWYVTETDTTRNLFRRGPLLNRAVWSTVPLIARHVLMALGPDDPDLILISWNGVSGSLSVLFDPALQADRPFHERKLDALLRYLGGHQPTADVPYECIDPAAVYRDST